jgi:hypothetical protein
MTAPAQFDFESEKIVLGVILRDPGSIEKIASIVSPPDFSESHGPICHRLIELFQTDRAVNVISLITALRDHGELEAAGGAAYVGTLTEGIPFGIDPAPYAERVRKSADARAARATIKTAVARAGDNGADPDTAIETLITELQQIRRASTKPEHRFERLAEDRFSLSLPHLGIVLEADRLRREHNELLGELAVRCRLPGARTFDGNLSIGDFNLSSVRARSERAKLLSDQSNAKELDWRAYLEELCQLVLAAERAGQPAVDLRTLERPGPDDAVKIEGLTLPRRHAAILFGDGGSCKSYLALYLTGRMLEQGLAVALFDWELCGEDHRDRLERLFGKAMPKICYARCERPLVYETDRLRRIVRDEKIDYAIYDSIAFACDGPPEAAEVASRYFRACRQIGVGSLHVAHVTKSEGGDQKPFGSVFFSNGARSTWYVKVSEASPDGRTLDLGLFNRKSNLGRLLSPTGFQITFTDDRTFFAKAQPGDSPDLAEKMTIRERMIHLLKSGAVMVDDLAESVDAKPDTIRKTVKRHSRTFTLLEGGQVALLQRVI